MNESQITKIFLKVVSLVGFALLYVPIVTLVLYSFIGLSGTPQFSLDAYRTLLQNDDLLEALTTSLQIALLSASASTVLGGLAALALERGIIPGRRIIDALTWTPLVLPEVVFGIGLLIWFVFLRISLGHTSLVIAHVTFSVSYVTLTVRERIRLLDPAIDDAASDLGATSWQIFTKVQLPLMMPALVAGWMMAFTLSFDDFLISFFTSGPDTVTLPTALYGIIKFGVTPEVFAMSSCIFCVSFISASLVAKFATPQHG